VNMGHPNNLMIDHHFPTYKKPLGGLSHLVSGLVHPSCRWIRPAYPTCFWVILHLLTGMSHKTPPFFLGRSPFFSSAPVLWGPVHLVFPAAVSETGSYGGSMFD
jgi:hypothetical protein